jgi:hypothetical protein
MAKIRRSFAFGKIENLTTPLEELENYASGREFEGDLGNRKGLRNIYRSENYLYFTFVKEIEDEYTGLDKDNEDTTKTSYPRKTMRVIVRDNGQFIFESRDQIYPEGAFRFLLEEKEENFDIKIYGEDKFDLNVMRAFYKSNKVIKKIKTKEIGEKKPNPHITDEEIKEITEQAGKHTSSGEFSVGHRKKNLKDADIVNEGFAKYSHLQKIYAEDEEENRRELSDRGKLRLSFPDDLDEQDESATIISTARSILDKLDDVHDLFGED